MKIYNKKVERKYEKNLREERLRDLDQGIMRDFPSNPLFGKLFRSNLEGFLTPPNPSISLVFEFLQFGRGVGNFVMKMPSHSQT